MRRKKPDLTDHPAPHIIIIILMHPHSTYVRVAAASALVIVATALVCVADRVAAEPGADAAAVAPYYDQALHQLPVSRLRRFLGERDAACDGCFEKRDLVARALEVRLWPTRADAVAGALSLEHDVEGALARPAPVGGDLSALHDMRVDETIAESPIVRPALRPLSDAEVAMLLDLHAVRLAVQLGAARCGPRAFNGSQDCYPAYASVSRMSE